MLKQFLARASSHDKRRMSHGLGTADKTTTNLPKSSNPAPLATTAVAAAVNEAKNTPERASYTVHNEKRQEEQQTQRNLEMGSSSPNLAIPSVPPSPGSATSNSLDAVAGMDRWVGRRTCPSSFVGGGQNTALSPPPGRELAAEDAPPELDALRPTFFSGTSRAISRRPPVTLAPVGVGGDSSPLPSLFSATSSTASDAVPPGWVNSQWQSQHYHGRIPADLGAGLGPPRDHFGLQRMGSSDVNNVTPAPPSTTVVVGMRARTGTDPGPPSSALLEAAKVVAASSSVGDSNSTGMSGRVVLASDEGSRRRSYVRSSSSGDGRHEHMASGLGGAGGRAGDARHQSRRASLGGIGDQIHDSLGRASSVDRSHSSSHAGSGGTGGVYEPSAFATKDVNGFAYGASGNSTPGAAVGGNGGGINESSANDPTIKTDSHSSNNATASTTSGPGRANVRIRGGGIDIISLLSGDSDVPGTSRTDDNPASNVSAGGGNNASASAFHGVHGYHSQDSNASSVGEFGYVPAGTGGAGGGSGRAVTPSSHLQVGGENYRADWPGGRPPLVRKRSLTVALDGDSTGGGGMDCPSPRGRRRSVEKPTDLPDTTRLESPSCPPRPLTAPSRGHNGGVGAGFGGGGCFSPPHYQRGRSVGANASPGAVSVGGARDCHRLASPSHGRLGSHPSSMTGSVTIIGNNASSTATTPATTVVAMSSSTGGTRSPMDVDWSNNTPTDSMSHAASPPISGATPSPAPSASSSVPTCSGSMLGRSPGPFVPSPGRESLRPGLNRAPHSPSPRRAPPSPAQAPGSAGLRRRGTRRLSAGSATGGRRRHIRVRSSGSLGGGSYRGDGSGTFDGSDYDSDVSEMSAYSAMGSLERQLQQDTFFELDEALWTVVTRREVCHADKCVYRSPHNNVSIRKHYHANCSHIHQEGVKKGMRFHHHQLEKVKKHQRSHSSHQARTPREPVGIVSPSAAYSNRARTLEGQSSREGISSGGEDDGIGGGGEDEGPWSSREIELLDSLVRSYVRSYGPGKWEEIARNLPNRGAHQCERQWTLRTRVQHVGGEYIRSRSSTTTNSDYHHCHESSRSGLAAGNPAGSSSHRGGGGGGGWSRSVGGVLPGGDRGMIAAPQDGSTLSGVSARETDANRGGRGGGDVLRQGVSGASSVYLSALGGSGGAGGSGGGSGMPGGSSTRGPKGVGSWTKEEDDRLNSLVAAFGVKWSQISDHMPGRVGKQCRERYLNHLDPSLRHGPWTEEEEALLLSLHARLNNQWAEIARQIPGRSDNDVKNRWNLVCRRERATEKGLKRTSPSGVNLTGRGSGGGSSGGCGGEGLASSSSNNATHGAAAGGVAVRGAPPTPGQQGQGPQATTTTAISRTLPAGAIEAAAASALTADGRRGPKVEEDESITEAREAAEAGAVLINLSLTAASTARDALEHSNFDPGAGAGSSGRKPNNATSGGSNPVGAGGLANVPMKRPPTPPVSPRFTRTGTGIAGQQQMISPRFSRASHHQHASSSPASSPRSSRIGHPPRSPTRAAGGGGCFGLSSTPPIPGHRGAGAPPQSPYAGHSTSSEQPLAIPRSPASENMRAGGTPPSSSRSGTRRHSGVADMDARRAAIAARAAAGGGGGVAAWPWGGRV